MAALWNRAGHYIFVLWFLSIYLSIDLLFFVAWSQRLHIGCLPYFDTWCSLSANLECMSEMCCTRLAENTGRKKIAKWDFQNVNFLRLILSTTLNDKLECGPMPNVMAALLNIGGTLCSTPQSLADTGVPCSNAAKSRNPLKFAVMAQTN